MNKTWWKEAVVYQIYPRSFKDSNGDGVGDLNGIISKLDYLVDLGVNVLWISPFFKSPNADNGYDISDYNAIQEEFGTMEDFDELLKVAHQKGIKIIIDLVVNHSSDEHVWFQESKKSKDNQYRDYYIWKPPTYDTFGNRQPPNNWISFFSGDAWTYDEASNEYYLHLFTNKQPDLNWENEKLREEVYDIMHFWLKKGVDGFRMDVIALISKDQNFANFPESRVGDLSYYANGPRIHEFLQEMNEKVLRHYDCMTIGEGFGVEAHTANLYVGNDRNELNMIYHFDHAVPREENCFIDPKNEFSLVEIKQIFNRWNAELGDGGWQNVYFGNHDNPRIVSRLGRVDHYHEVSAKMLAMALLCQRGTVGLYQGDEIGMTNCAFEDINEFNDVQVLNAYASLVVDQGNDKAKFLEATAKIARDHARTPMQWSNQNSLAGFTTGPKAWLKVNRNYKNINVKTELENPNSILNFYKKMIWFRKVNKTLLYGDYEDLMPDDPNVYFFRRNLQDSNLFIICNFSDSELKLDLSFLAQNIKIKVLLSNYDDAENNVFNNNLLPYQSILGELKNV